MSDINLILYRDSKTYDISELVESIKWKGRKGSAARSVSISLLDCKGAQSGIDVTKGHQLIFSYKGEELFRGMIMSQQQSESFKMPITAYDNGIYLSNNKDTFVYENKTIHDIFILGVLVLNIRTLPRHHTRLQSLQNPKQLHEMPFLRI